MVFMWFVVLAIGAVTWVVAWFMWVPPARELIIKLGTLLDMARRANPQLYAERLAPLSPFVSPKVFKMNKVAPVLRADLSEFGAIPQKLQREAKQLDRKAHYALIPGAVYVVGVGVWWLVR